MKAFFENCDHRQLKSEHCHHACLEGQIVVIDCYHKLEAVRIDLYKKGQTYYCCLWINEPANFFVTGSGKGKTRFGAVYAALGSAGISFDYEPPILGGRTDTKVWHCLKPFVLAIAEATGTGSDDCYIHDCLRSN